jgi:transcription initiation factor TFIID subunit 7
MLVVGNKIQNEDAMSRNKNFNIDEFIWPHGITPPLHHVRKRRFRKRVNKRVKILTLIYLSVVNFFVTQTIESVEEEVERLLGEDTLAAEVKYGLSPYGKLYGRPLIFGPLDILENVNPDLSDSEFIEPDEPVDAPTPFLGSEGGDAPTPSGDLGDPEGEERSENSGSEEGDIDEELAAELDLALGDDDDDAGQGEDEDDEDEDEDESEEEDDDDDDDDEAVQARKLLNEEISDLEAAVRKKGNEIASSANPLIRVGSFFSCYHYLQWLTLRFTETIRRRIEEAHHRPGDEAFAAG